MPALPVRWRADAIAGYRPLTPANSGRRPARIAGNLLQQQCVSLRQSVNALRRKQLGVVLPFQLNALRAGNHLQNQIKLGRRIASRQGVNLRTANIQLIAFAMLADEHDLKNGVKLAARGLELFNQVREWQTLMFESARKFIRVLLQQRGETVVASDDKLVSDRVDEAALASFNVGSFLLAIGLPMTTRSVADSLAISNAKAECNSVNSVVPLCLANWARADCSSFVSDVLTIFCVFPAAVMAISYSSACFPAHHPVHRAKTPCCHRHWRRRGKGLQGSGKTRPLS